MHPRWPITSWAAAHRQRLAKAFCQGSRIRLSGSIISPRLWRLAASQLHIGRQQRSLLRLS
jgi:hypothetical protein